MSRSTEFGLHKARKPARWALATLLLLSASVVVLGQNQPGRIVLDEAPLDRVVAIPRTQLEDYFRRAHDENLGYIRMLEGGEFNVNIRHAENVNEDNFFMLTHPDTIDVWVVQQGSGTLLTGGEAVGDRHVGGEERFLNVGDLVFIPAGVPHGVKETELMTWLNIRFPEHRN